MTNQLGIPADVLARYEVHEWRNGLAILIAAHPDEWVDILKVLRGFSLLRSDILKPGGRKSGISDKLDGHFFRLGWKEKGFDTGPSYGSSTTHMARLRPRLEGGSGGGCPVVVFGIRGAAYVED
jgi:hypothetical protein